MSFLPLVERELRVTSRRKGTYWIRCGAALLGVLFLLPALAVASVSGPRSGAGAIVFNCMAWYGAVACTLAGAFLGADGIAEERREGTLGFLFLTNLKAYDVVLGKFLGASLNASYGLLAMVPVLGLSLLGGGVTGGEFWRVSITLVNLLFFSTTLAILISARTKSEMRPTLFAMGALILIWVGGAAADAFYISPRYATLARLLHWLSLASPGETFSLASAASYLYRHGDFWRSLVISHALGWVFLGLACWRLDASIDDQQRRQFLRRRARSSKLLEVAPIAWLLDDSRWLRVGVWGLCGMGALASFVVAPTFFSVLSLIYLLIKILFATSACRFFAEGRRTGALELLRTTPLAGREMIAEQWVALRRIFMYPVCLLLTAQIAAVFYGPAKMGWFSTPYAFYIPATEAADFFAIGWGGMWVSLRCRRPGRAIWLTILFFILIPIVLFCLPNIVLDVILIPMARSKVSKHLAIYLAVRREEPRDYRPVVRG